VYIWDTITKFSGTIPEIFLNIIYWDKLQP